MRRTFLQLLAAVPLATATAAIAQASAWPGRPVKVIVGFPPGTPPDIFARLYSERLSREFGVPFIVENRPGAGGNIASDAVAKAPADGHTLLYTVSNALTMNPHLYRKLGFDAQKDLVAVAPTLQQGLVIVANNNLPAKSLPEVIAMGRTTPLTYGSYGPGGYPHLIMETTLDAAKVRMTHVPYRQGVMTDLVGGQIHLLAEPIATAIGFIESGKVRPIAYTGPTRHRALPDLPTVSETYRGISAIGWHGFWTTASTSPDTVKRLNQSIIEATRSPEIGKRIADLHCDALTNSPTEMTARVMRDSDMWGQVIRDKEIKLD